MAKFKFYIYQFESFLHQPFRIMILCVVVFIASLIGNGTLWKLWSLYQNEVRFSQEIIKLNEEAQKLDKQMIMAKDPQFIEHLAKDKMDLVGENDLIFIFPN